MSDKPDTGAKNTNEELAESGSYRFNLDSLDDYIAVGEKVAKEGRLDEAVEVMREATHRYPESPTGRYNLGVALFLRVKKDREHQELWENLADDEQFADEAMAALEGAVAADPKFTQAYNNLGRLYALRGRKEDALAAWKKSLELNPDQPEVQEEMEDYRDKFGPRKEDIETEKLMGKDQPEGSL